MPSMNFLSEKARKPKFELHLKIHDLNNVPLVSGTSIIKWHLASSIHAEHRGRTDRCPIANHRVDYNYSRIVSSIRIPIDKGASLAECPIEFEVLQEFAAPGGRDEKMVLGMVRLNLSEYVEESDALMSRKRGSVGMGMGMGMGMAMGGTGGGAAATMATPTSTASQGGQGQGQGQGQGTTSTVVVEEPAVEEGIVRRYLMQESKVNSTLKISILMVQIDGERNYVAPPLKTAPVFGGIAGIMAGEQAEQDDARAGQIPSISKSHDAAEVQDMYRRALAASWSAQPGELSAEEVIESIFAGGDGWSLPPAAKKHGHVSSSSSSSSSSPSEDEAASSGFSDNDGMGGGTLRPSDLRRIRKHGRQHSGGARHGSKNGTGTGTGTTHTATTHTATTHTATTHTATTHATAIRDDRTTSARDGSVGAGSGSSVSAQDHGRPERNRSESLTSLAPTMGSSDRGREPGLKRAREVKESEMRDDWVAWRLPGRDT